MKQSIRRLTFATAAFALALPAIAGAQRPEPRELPRADATRIIGLRRQLDLTPRQLTQLDSIERVTHAERRANAEQMRTRMVARRDSMRPRNDSLRRARMEAMRPQMEQMRRRDSTSRAAAERVLNDAQRQQLREIQAEERGRQRGMREARGGQGRGQMRRPGQDRQRGIRGPQGMRGPQGARPPQGMRGDRPRAPMMERGRP